MIAVKKQIDDNELNNKDSGLSKVTHSSETYSEKNAIIGDMYRPMAAKSKRINPIMNE